MVVKAASLTQPRLLHPRVNTLPTARPHTFRIFTFDKAQLKSVRIDSLQDLLLSAFNVEAEELCPVHTSVCHDGLQWPARHLNSSRLSRSANTRRHLRHLLIGQRVYRAGEIVARHHELNHTAVLL